jgi:hypothetical protein
VILAVTVPAHGLAASTLENRGWGVSMYTRSTASAGRADRRTAAPAPAQPRQDSIELMEIELVDAGDGVIFAQAIRSVGAAHKQPVQNGEEHSAFQCLR